FTVVIFKSILFSHFKAIIIHLILLAEIMRENKQRRYMQHFFWLHDRASVLAISAGDGLLNVWGYEKRLLPWPD
ncbi:hypothetical protein ACJX0J_035285, partial [Zea mays]